MEFDANFYLKQNPDVAAAIGSGGFSSALEHYQKYGQKEGRAATDPVQHEQYRDGFLTVANNINNPTNLSAIKAGLGTGFQSAFNSGASAALSAAANPNVSKFNESVYLQNNPDVAAAIKDGKFANAMEHYLKHGIRENRTAFEAPKAAPAAAAPTFQRRDDSVVNSLTKMMSQDSPLMRQAQTAGLQQANRRGLLNSSMAVQAAQDAAYTAAVPIASQEASQAAAENLANLDASTRIFLQGQTIDAADRQQQAEIGYQTAMKQLDRSLQEKLAKWNLDETQRGSAAQSVLASQELYNNRINNIMANTNLDAPTREAQMASAKAFFDIQMDLVQQMYDVSLNWN